MQLRPRLPRHTANPMPSGPAAQATQSMIVRRAASRERLASSNAETPWYSSSPDLRAPAGPSEYAEPGVKCSRAIICSARCCCGRERHIAPTRKPQLRSAGAPSSHRSACSPLGHCSARTERLLRPEKGQRILRKPCHLGESENALGGGPRWNGGERVRYRYRLRQVLDLFCVAGILPA
jgi:hypothetical protein